MARKLIIENLMKLASEIGANPNKYMGTKTNINFLGTGDKAMKGTTFGGKLNDDFLNLGVSQDDLIKVVEQDMGYVTSGKLNDSQLKVMTDNLTMARDALNPVPPTNLFDIATGTGGINKQGLESLRKGSSLQNVRPVNYSGELTSVPSESGYSGLSYAIKNPTPLTDKISEGINRLKVQKTGFAKKGEVGNTPAQSLDRGFMEAEGARRAVLRQALLKDENALKSLPDGVVDSLKNSKDLMGKANSGNDPLILFRAIYGDAVDFNKIDDIIASEPFSDANTIADKVLAFLKQGDNFADGGRIGYRSGRSVKGIMDLIKSSFGKDSIKLADDIERPDSALSRDMFKAFNDRYKNKLDIDEDIAIRAKELKMDKNQKDLDYVEDLYKVHRKDEAGVGTLKEYHADFEEATGLKVPMENLRTAWRSKREYPFTTPIVDFKGKDIGAQATQKMYPESPKFIVQDAETLTKNINDMRSGKIPRSSTGERIGLDVEEIPAGFKLSRSKLSEKFPELGEDMLDEIMDLDNDMLARTIKMLENRRLDPVAYDKLLLEKGDTLEFQAAFDKITRRKNNAKGGLARILEM